MSVYITLIYLYHMQMHIQLMMKSLMSSLHQILHCSLIDTLLSLIDTTAKNNSNTLGFVMYRIFVLSLWRVLHCIISMHLLAVNFHFHRSIWQPEMEVEALS